MLNYMQEQLNNVKARNIDELKSFCQRLGRHFKGMLPEEGTN